MANADTNAASDSDADADSDADTDADGDADGVLSFCASDDTYTQLAINCYVDDISGNDRNDGHSPLTAVSSQSAVHDDCAVVRYQRVRVRNDAGGMYSNR